MPITKSAAFESFSAAADYLGPGSIEVNRYEPEILDMVRRGSVFLQRVTKKPANGHPHRYFEQTAIQSASFSDVRNVVATASTGLRLERAAFLKAITAQSNFGLFDMEISKMQGQFASLEAKDIQDIINSIIVAEAQAVWAGNDTSMVMPTTNQYMSVLNQVANSGTTLSATVVLPGSSIVDAIKSDVAAMAAQTGFVVAPTAIYLNPVTIDLIDKEAKAQHISLETRQITAGITVKFISTVVGDLPLITDPWLVPTASGTLPTGMGSYFSAAPANYRSHWAVIVTEPMIEMPVSGGDSGNTNPRIFKLGLLGNLVGQYVGIHFNTIIVKGAPYAHSIVQVLRP